MLPTKNNNQRISPKKENTWLHMQKMQYIWSNGRNNYTQNKIQMSQM